jgi:hypothetical protein
VRQPLGGVVHRNHTDDVRRVTDPDRASTARDEPPTSNLARIQTSDPLAIPMQRKTLLSGERRRNKDPAPQERVDQGVVA